MAKTPAGLVAMAMSVKGTRYVFGAYANPANPHPAAFDCSELVLWASRRIGVTGFPDGARTQFYYCRKKGLEIPISRAVHTEGALFYRINGSNNNRHDHTAISRGDGTTIEAGGRATGVYVTHATGRPWTNAALMPQLNYGQTGVGTAPVEGPEGGVAQQVPTVDPGDILRLLSSIVKGMRTVQSQGSVGVYVFFIQVRLQQLGYPLDATQHFDYATKTMVQKFQSDHHLRSDGVVGPVTWTNLFPGLTATAFPSGL